MQLLGLYWAGSDTGVHKRLTKAILTEQQADGGEGQPAHGASSAVRRRSRRTSTSGFPYAGDQWINAWATGWATMAPAQAIEAPGTHAAR